MQLQHGHVVFYALHFLHFFFQRGGVKTFFIHDALYMMHDAGYTFLNPVPPPPSLWSTHLWLKSRPFCTFAHASNSISGLDS